MNKRLMAILCAFVLPLSGCSVSGGETLPPEGAYKVYYAVTGKQATVRSVDYEYRIPDADAETASALARMVMTAPETYGLSSPVRPEVHFRSAELEEDGRLHLDLSEQYGGLSGIDLTIANACFTLTLCQLEDVDSVYITVEGEPIPYQTLQLLRESDLVLSGAEEETVTISATLYFPWAGGYGLAAEQRDVVKTESEGVAAALVSALLAGSRSGDGVRRLMPEGTQLRSVTVENGVCTVDLSGEFLSGMPEVAADARLLIYSLVNTVCAMESLEVQSVQLLVEGQRVPDYGGVNAAVPLEPDFTLAQ